MTFALELPTSGFADAVGRRPVYLTAAVLGVVAAVGIALAQSFWWFVAAAVVTGAFRALDSGPLEAWFVDAVHATTPGADVDRQLSRAGSVLGGAIAVGALASGGLIWWDPVRTVFGVSGVSALDAAAWVSAALTVVHLVAAAALMTEQRPPAAAGRSQWSHALSEARTTPAVIASGVAAGHQPRATGPGRRRGVLVGRHDHLRVPDAAAPGGTRRVRGAGGGPGRAGVGRRVGAVRRGLVARRGDVGTHRRRPSGHGRARAQCPRGRGHGVGGRPGRARRGLPVHLLHARDERPAPRGAAPSAGDVRQPRDGAVDQLDDGLPRLRRGGSARRHPRRPGVDQHGHGHRGRDQRARRGVLSPGPTAGAHQDVAGDRCRGALDVRHRRPVTLGA